MDSGSKFGPKFIDCVLRTVGSCETIQTILKTVFVYAQ